MYGEHLLADEQRMAKSAGNFFILADIEASGFEALAYRLLCLQAHYRSKLNFTWNALDASQRALDGLRGRIAELKAMTGPAGFLDGGASLREQFRDAVSDDLDTPRGIAILWEALKSNIPATEKLALALDFDQVLGLGFDRVVAASEIELSSEVVDLIEVRDAARKAKDWSRSDALRDQLHSLGYEVHDTPEGTKVKAK
jgi:cysteinyl-tRNA synthetase